MADEAAEKVALPDQDIKLIGHINQRAWKVQKRITAVHEIACSGDRRECQRKPRSGRPAPVTIQDKVEDLRRLGHVIVELSSAPQRLRKK